MINVSKYDFVITHFTALLTWATKSQATLVHHARHPTTSQTESVSQGEVCRLARHNSINGIIPVQLCTQQRNMILLLLRSSIIFLSSAAGKRYENTSLFMKVKYVTIQVRSTLKLGHRVGKVPELQPGSGLWVGCRGTAVSLEMGRRT